MAGTDVSKSYVASSLDEQRDAYDTWATKSEPDLCAMGYRIPVAIAARPDFSATLTTIALDDNSLRWLGTTP